MKILLVEDDIEISTMLKNFLTTEDFEVITAQDGKSACEKFFSDSFNLVLLDLMIPKINGMEVMQRIREKSTVPIIIISAKDTDSDKTLGLGLGADDYITKPFDIDEVILRINAVLRRSEFQIGKKISFRNITLNTESKRVFVSDKEIICTAMEYSILELLIKNPDKIFSKRNLFESITGEDYVSDENTMNVHISNLRKKLRQADDSEYIETVYGMGYRLIN